jgi:hypothetical protein
MVGGVIGKNSQTVFGIRPAVQPAEKYRIDFAVAIARPAPFSLGPSGLAVAPTFVPSSGIRYTPGE